MKTAPSIVTPPPKWSIGSPAKTPLSKRFWSRLLLLVALPVVPALGLVFYTNVELRRLGATQVTEQAVRLAQLEAVRQEGIIENTRLLLNTLAEPPYFRGNNRALYRQQFTNLLKLHPEYTDFGLIEFDGGLYASAVEHSAGTNFANEAVFQRSVASRGFAVGDFHTGRGARRASLDFGCALLDENGRVVRVLFAALDLSWLNEAAARIRLPPEAAVTVVGPANRILVRHPNPEQWVGKVAFDPSLMGRMRELGEGPLEMRGDTGRMHLYAVAPISGGGRSGLLVCVDVPWDVAYAAANQVLFRNVIWVALIAGLAILAARMYARQFILRPVNTLIHASKRLAGGDLGARTGIPDGSDELHQLTRAFDEMAGTLESRTKAMTQAEAKFRTLVEQSIVGIYIIQGDVFAYVNPKMGEILDRPLDQIVGAPVIDFIAEQDQSIVRDNIAKRLQGGVRDIHYTLRLVRSDGTLVHAEAHGARAEYDGKPAIIGTLLDITERKQAEEKIVASLHEKEVLLKEIHHRIKNNMQVITSLFSLQAGRVQNPEMLALLKENQARVQAMALVHERLYRTPEFARIEFDEYLRNLAASLIRCWGVGASSTRLKFDVDPVPLGIDTAIPCGLIVNELLSNACKYAFPNGRAGEIRIGLHRDASGLVTLTVADDGVGMPPGLDFRHTESLGLQLVNTLAEQLGAELEVNVAGGTEFRMKFNEQE